jgi:alkanesulfonate monooxygenase SsuD/methylene tetrahydromethanopterin reductase-like flavin-dependent oxidoreductase (luciferase family)
MRIGVSPFASTAPGIRRLATAAVDGGIDTIWLGDGLLVVDAFPMWSGGLEPFVELSYFAGRHPGIRVGLGAAVLPLRDVLWLAKQATTLDQLTEGQFVLVVAPGFWEREFLYRGLSYGERGRRFEDLVGALRAAFAGAPYKGESVTLPPDGRLSPVPFTPGGPPLWYAGGPHTFDRAIRDGVPFQARPATPAVLAETAREWFDRGGTDLAVRVSFEFSDRVDSTDDRVRGPASYLADQLAAYEELGVADISLMPGRDDDASLRTIEALTVDVLPDLAARAGGR